MPKLGPQAMPLEPGDPRRCHVIKKDGEQCKKWAITGSTVCRTHGGNMPHVKQAAAVRIHADKTQLELMARLKAGQISKADTITEMDRLASEAIAFKDIASEEMAALLAAKSGLGYEHRAGEQVRAAVQVYERALDRCNTILATNVKLGIAERKARLDEAEKLALLQVIKNILAGLNLTPEQKRMSVEVVPAALRAIEGPK